MTTFLRRPDVAPAPAWRFPRSRTTVLSNGLTVVAYDLPGKKIAAVTALLDLGHAAEPSGFEGLANITLSALNEGTAAYDAQGFAIARDRIGATYRTHCETEAGNISVSVPVAALDAALDLLAEAVLRPTFPGVEIDRLVKQRLDGISNELADPASRATIELAKAYYAGSSRRAIPGGGTPETVARIDRAAVEGFYVRRSDPATTTIVVAADLSGVDLDQLVEERFGAWISVGHTRALAAPTEVNAGPRVVVVDRPGAVQTQLLLAAPSVGKDNPDLPPVMVSAYALGGGMDSRIMAVLREEKGYTYGISAQARSERADGQLVVGGAVQTEVTGPAVEDLMAILRHFAAAGVREEERVPAVEALAGRAPLQYEQPEGVAAAAASVLINGLPEDHIDRQLAALRATTVDGVNSAFARSVPVDQAILVAVGDSSVITESLKGAGLGDVTVVPA